jgi:hypothetical protein
VILLPLPPECWDYTYEHHTWLNFQMHTESDAAIPPLRSLSSRYIHTHKKKWRVQGYSEQQMPREM